VIPSRRVRNQFQTPLFWGLKDMARRTSGKKSLPPKPRGIFTPGLALMRGSPLNITLIIILALQTDRVYMKSRKF
jgi:hypothetical protein